MSNAIEIHNLTKRYKRRKGADIVAVDSLTLNVPSGQVLGFLGPNGAGKTTSIKMLCGLVTPSGGRATLNGHDVTRQRRKAMKSLGAVLEGTRNVYWRLSAWENLMYFGKLRGVWGRTLKDRAERLLRELNLWDRRDQPVRSYSRGMQQRLAIACALVSDPSVVVLDEPTLGLDVESALVVKDWTVKLAHEEGKTVLSSGVEFIHRRGLVQIPLDLIWSDTVISFYTHAVLAS